jgi:hypothetical protein
MRPKFLLITALVVASLAVAPVAAQENATETDTGFDHEDLTGEDCTVHIDRHVSLCSVEHRNGEVILEFRTDRPETITVTDAGGMMHGGEILRKDFLIRGDRSTVRMPVTKANGFVGVTIDTGRVLYGVPVETSSSLIGGPWDYSDTQAAALGGGIGSAVVVLLLTLKTIYGRESGIERVA